MIGLKVLLKERNSSGRHVGHRKKNITKINTSKGSGGF
jgi:hypothetical protein